MSSWADSWQYYYERSLAEEMELAKRLAEVQRALTRARKESEFLSAKLMQAQKATNVIRESKP